MAEVVCQKDGCELKGKPQPAGSKYCEGCGDELPASSGAASTGTAGAKCPSCLNDVQPGDVACSVCQKPLGAAPAQPVAPPPPPPPPAAPVASVAAPAVAAGTLQPGSVKLTVTQGKIVGKEYLLDEPSMVMGRLDQETRNFPEIDLEDQDPEFVHRKHATLSFEGGNLFVCHHGTVNPTLVNKEPVAVNAKKQLAVGDKIQIGKVVLKVNKAA